MKTEILSVLLQVSAPLLLALATVLGTIVTRAASKYLDAKTTKILRDGLHDSAANGLKYAIAKGVKPSDILATATEYVKTKNPDTVKKLRVSDTDIKDIIRTKPAA